MIAFVSSISQNSDSWSPNSCWSSTPIFQKNPRLQWRLSQLWWISTKIIRPKLWDSSTHNPRLSLKNRLSKKSMLYHHLPIQTAILGYPHFRTRSCYRIVAYIYIYLFIYLYGCVSHVISRCSIFPSFLFVLYPLYLFVSNVIPVITVGQFPSHIPLGEIPLDFPITWGCSSSCKLQVDV